MIDISKVVTPGEFMLQSAAVRGDASAAIGRGMMIGAQQKENKQRNDLLKQELESKQKAMNDFALWQNSIQSIKDPIERIRRIGSIPVQLLADDGVSKAYSGMVNQAKTEYELSQKAEEISGLADDRKFKSEMLRLGVPMDAKPGDPVYDRGVELHRQRRALSIAAELGLTPDQVMTDQLPTLANGRLDEELFKASATFASPTQREKGMTANMKDAAYLTRLEERVASLPEGSPERAAAQRELSNFQLTTAPAGTEIETKEGLRIRTGVRGSPATPTIGFLGQIQKKVNETRINLQELQNLGTKIQQSDVGVPGKLSELFLDRIGPMVGLDTADIGRMERRAALKMTFEGLKRDISDDTRFSIADLKDLKQIGISDDWFNSSKNVATAARIIAEYMAKRNIMNLQSANMPISWDQLKDPMEVWAAYTRGIGPDGKVWPMSTPEDQKRLDDAYTAFIGGSKAQ